MNLALQHERLFNLTKQSFTDEEKETDKQMSLYEISKSIKQAYKAGATLEEVIQEFEIGQGWKEM